MDVSKGRYRGGATRWPGRAAGSALLLVIALGGFGPGVGALFSTAKQAMQAELTVLTGDAGPVYTMADLRRAVARGAGGRQGRTILVQGRLGDALVQLCPGEPLCLGQPTLGDAAAVGALAPLPLEWGGLDPLRAAVQRLPVVGRLLPLSNTPRWGVAQTYRVRLELPLRGGRLRQRRGARRGAGRPLLSAPSRDPAVPVSGVISCQGEDSMPRYLVERTFTDGLHIPLTDEGATACRGVVDHNADLGVTWIHSYVTADKAKTYCIDDGPSPAAIRQAAQRTGLPVDHITPVSVLDPYFYQ